MSKDVSKLEDLTPDDLNANRGTKRGLDLLEKSLEKYGAGRAILVDRNGKIIAGNKTALAAAEKGFPARVVRTDGKELVVVMRDDLDMDADPRARELGIADNRVAQVDLDWDADAMGELSDVGIDLKEFFFDDELDRLLGRDGAPPEPEAVGTRQKTMAGLPVVRMSIADLKPHPQNYRAHPEDQLKHIIESIREHGFYRNIIVAKDGTILAGHGVAQAAKAMGLDEVPVVRLDIEPDDPRALKLLAGDNEISRLAEIDDRAFTEMMKGLAETGGLLGTGFDEMQLAALAMVTRPQSEIRDKDEAAQWMGMPEYDPGEKSVALTVHFKTEEERTAFADKVGIDPKSGKRFTTSTASQHWSVWWPPREKNKEDLSAVRFEEEREA